MNNAITTLLTILCSIGTYACIVAAGLVYGFKCGALVCLALLLAGIARGVWDRWLIL